MSPQDRFIGVARPPQGVDPEPPRLVVDLSKGVHSGQKVVRAIGSAAPIPPARPRGYAIESEHRRRLRRAVVRRWELAMWCGAAAVVVVLAVVLLGGLPRDPAMLSAGTVSGVIPGPQTVAPEGSASPSVGASAVGCFLVSCSASTLSGAPTVLRIPALSVNTALESLVLNASHELQPPRDYAKAGWWTQGVAPGDVGAAVIAGHVDSAKSGPAVFYNLRELKPGDTVTVDRGGQSVVFAVTEVEQYPKNAFPTGRVYQPTPDAELRLITCGGTFDRSQLSYRDNIVVYAVRVPGP